MGKSREANVNLFDVAIVGAGICGLTAARDLAAGGRSVVVLDKGRGPGGRAATRLENEWQFDHGAQYFTAQSAAFAHQLDAWRQSGVAGEWQGHIISVAPDGGQRPLSGTTRRYVGIPGMHALALDLAEGLNCRFGALVQSLSFDGQWQVRLEQESVAARNLVVTLPAPQASGLLGAQAPGVASVMAKVTMAPCWALLVGLNEPFDPGYQGAFVNTGPLGWVACSSGKPGRDHRPTWVAHATDSWSRQNLELDRDEAREALWSAFRQTTGYAAKPALCRPHRWRYARADHPLDAVCLSDPERSVWAGGDWCAGSRIEGAWRSGRQIAAEILAAGQ